MEGEALAVAWSLEQTKYFTLGCYDLDVVTDHKPLTKLLGDRRFDEIDNPRLFRLKRRTLMWNFKMEYQRGCSNPFADAMSRKPNKYAELASCSLMSEEDKAEASFVMGIASEVDTFFAVTWDRVKAESLKDLDIKSLVEYIKRGFPDSRSSVPDTVKPFWEIRKHLHCSDGVALFKDRIIIPKSLRTLVLATLHSAHQGVSSMFSRAQATVFWPGMTLDLETARKSCNSCNRNAPSQTKLPPSARQVPNLPFQMIFADFFTLKGKNFLVFGDRLSGWTEVLRVNTRSGSKGLCEALRTVFSTFGVPEETSSDGGPGFAAQEFKDFFARWMSSDYFAQSNGRAEVAVKAMKRLIEENMGINGYLDNDKIVRALLQQMNTPDNVCKLSPCINPLWQIIT